MTKKEQRILHGPLKGTLLLLAGPVIATGFFTLSYNLADSFFLGRIGTTEVAVGAVTAPLITLLVNFANGFATGGGILLGQKIGARKRDEAKKILVNTFLLVLLLGAVLGGAGILLLPAVLNWIGNGDAELFGMSYRYTLLIYSITPFTMLISAYAAIRQAQGMILRPSVLTLLSVLFKILLNALFLFVFPLGILGVALSTVIAKGLLSLYMLAEIFFNKESLDIRRRDIRPDPAAWKEIVQVGLPLSLAATVVSFGFTFMTKLASGFGKEFLVLYGISSRINNIIFMISGSLGIALSIFVSLNYGARNFDRIRKGRNFLMVLSILWSLVSIGATLLFGRFLVGFFTTHDETIRRCLPFAYVMSLANLFWAPYSVFSKFLEGCRLTKITMYLNIARFWLVRVPFAYLFALATPLREYGIPAATILSCAVCLAIAWAYYLHRGKKAIFSPLSAAPALS